MAGSLKVRTIDAVMADTLAGCPHHALGDGLLVERVPTAEPIDGLV